MRVYVAAAALLVIFFCELFFASAVKSPAWDEPGHISSGVAYVQLGSLAVNPQHPPLLKALSGLGLTLSGGKWPNIPEAQALLNGDARWQWDIGSLMLYKAGLDRALMWARMPMMLVGIMGGLVLFLWARQLAGPPAAIAALMLYVLDPTIVGHSFLVTLDVGLGAFSLLFLFCLWNYVRTSSQVWMTASGIALGMALCTKFSSIVLLPVGGVLWLAGSLTFEKPAPVKKKGARPAEERAQPRWRAPLSGVWILAIAAVIVMLIYRFQGFSYIEGATKVNADHVEGYKAYMAGDLAPNFSSYFAVAYLLKEPLAAIALAALGLFLVVRGKLAARDKLFLIVPPVALFAIHVWKADDLGIRYIIPCLPFAHLLGGIALAELFRGQMWMRVAAAAACVWVVMAAAGIYPDGLSYFNESACLLNDPKMLGLDGGSRCGVAWLDDSNLDWGEGLKQLQAWMEQNAKGRTARLVYFGSFRPGAYESLAVEQMSPEDTFFRPPPGLYAVSAHIVAHNTALVRHGDAAGDEWMQRLPPRAIVGHCLYIYDIPAK